MQLTKQIIKVGNGAGVLLPREWLNGLAKVELIEKPLDIQKDILGILESHLSDILSIALVGSYARNEQTQRSDIDVLVITNSANKQIKKGKYNIILISEKSLEKELQHNILPWLPMLREAKPIINAQLIEKLSTAEITKKNLEPHLELTKSAMDVVKEYLKMEKETVSDNIAYSLGLRLRQVYIVDCILSGKKQNSKDLKRLIKRVTGSLELYNSYIRAKDDNKTQSILPISEASKAYNYILKRIGDQEK